jgi:hypothetical protein
MTSRFAVLQVRPSGKKASRTAQEQAGGRSRWDGVLPLRTLLVERPEEADEPSGHWMTSLPATTPVADLARWAKMCWWIEHDYRELKHGLGLDQRRGPRTRSVSSAQVIEYGQPGAARTPRRCNEAGPGTEHPFH